MTPADWFETFSAGVRLAFDVVETGVAVLVACTLAGIGGSLGLSVAKSKGLFNGRAQRAETRARSHERIARHQPDAWDWPARPADTYERKDAA